MANLDDNGNGQSSTTGLPLVHGKNSFDVAQAFMLFVAFNGNVKQVAHALEIKDGFLEKIAVQEKWSTKLEELGRDPQKGPAAQIAFNRGINYVQAHRLRGIVDAAIDHIRNKIASEGETGFKEIFEVVTKDSRHFSTRPLTDLVKAAEACHEMTSRALGDSNAVPKKDTKAGELFVQVQAAMDAAAKLGVDSATTVKELTIPKT